MRNKKYVALSIVSLMGFFLGYTLYYRQINHHMHVAQIFAGRQLTIRGQVQKIDSTFSETTFPYCVHIKILQAHDCKTGHEIPNAPGELICIYTKKLRELCIQDTIHLPHVSFSGTTRNPASGYFAYLLKEGIAQTAFTSYFNSRLLHRPKYSLWRWIHQKRFQLLRQLSNHMSPLLYRLYGLIFLGKRVCPVEEMQPIKQNFAQWGISHYLARSGLHVSIFIFIWIMALRCIPIHFIVKQLILIFLCLIYMALSWTSISFFRTLLSFFLYRLALLNKKNAQRLHILTLITLGVIVVNPAQATCLDFQLSFALTAALIYFYQFYQTPQYPHLHF